MTEPSTFFDIIESQAGEGSDPSSFFDIVEGNNKPAGLSLEDHFNANDDEIIRQAKANPGFLDRVGQVWEETKVAAEFGVQYSVGGLAYRQQMPDAYGKHFTSYQHTLSGIISETLDLPFWGMGMALGAGATGANPVGAYGGGMALTEGMRKVYIDRIQRGEIKSIDEFLHRLGGASKETMKGYVTGMAGGGVAGKLGNKGVEMLGSAAAMAAAGSLLEGQLPTLEDFKQAGIEMMAAETAQALLLRGRGGVSTYRGRVKKAQAQAEQTRLEQKAMWIHAATGRPVHEIVTDFKTDKQFATEMLSKENVVPTKYRGEGMTFVDGKGKKRELTFEEASQLTREEFDNLVYNDKDNSKEAFAQAKRLVGQRVINEVGSSDPQAIADYYHNKYGLKKEMKVVWTEYKDQAGSTDPRVLGWVYPGDVAEGGNPMKLKDYNVHLNTTHWGTDPAAVDPVKLAGVIRHEIEHVIDVDRRGYPEYQHQDWNRMGLLQNKDLTLADMLREVHKNHHRVGDVQDKQGRDHFDTDYVYKAIMREALERGQDVHFQQLKHFPDLAQQYKGAYTEGGIMQKVARGRQDKRTLREKAADITEEFKKSLITEKAALEAQMNELAGAWSYQNAKASDNPLKVLQVTENGLGGKLEYMLEKGMFRFSDGSATGSKGLFQLYRDIGAENLDAFTEFAVAKRALELERVHGRKYARRQAAENARVENIKQKAIDKALKLTRQIHDITAKMDALEAKKETTDADSAQWDRLQKQLVAAEKKLKTAAAQVEVNKTLKPKQLENNARHGFEHMNLREVVETGEARGFEDAFNELQRIRHDMLDYAQAAGLISTKTVDYLKNEHRDYIPFKRLMEAEKAQKRGGRVRQTIKALSENGSERPIHDPLKQMASDMVTMFSMAEKNYANKSYMKWLQKYDQAGEYWSEGKPKYERNQFFEQLAEDTHKKVEDIIAEDFVGDGTDTITVFDRGEKKVYHVKPEIAELYNGTGGDPTASDISIRMFEAIMQKPAGWLRAGATLTPDFAARNLLRDQMGQFVFSKYGYSPIDFVVGGMHAIMGQNEVGSFLNKLGVPAGSKLYDDFVKSGAAHATMVSVDRAHMDKRVADELRDTPWHNKVNPMTLLRAVSDTIEQGTRIAEYKKATEGNTGKKGSGTKRERRIEAAYQARDITLDFQRAGVTGRKVNKIAAFFNAVMQGHNKVYRELANPETRKRALMRAITGIMVPSIALNLMNNIMWEEEYAKVPSWQKDLFWVTFFKSDGQVYKVMLPKPHELGLIFGSLPERGVQYLWDMAKGKNKSRAAQGLGDTLMNLVPGMAPTALVPLVENKTNYSFFRGRKLMSQAVENVAPEYRYTIGSSETSKVIAKGLSAIPGLREVADGVGVSSPVQIDNLIRGWTGGTGRYTLQLIDQALLKVGAAPVKVTASMDWAEFPVVRAFFARNNTMSAAPVQDFYKQYEELRQYAQATNKLMNEYRFEEASRAMRKSDFKALSGIYQSITEMSSLIRSIQHMPPADDSIDLKTLRQEKRQIIDELTAAIIQTAIEGNRLAEHILEAQKGM